MAQTYVNLITETALIAAVSATGVAAPVAPLVNHTVNGIAVPGTVFTTVETWPVTAALVGADLELTLDATPDPAAAGAADAERVKPEMNICFEDANGDVFCVKHPWVVKFIYTPPPNQLPVGQPDATTIQAGNTLNLVVIGNDSDPDGTVVDAQLVSGSVQTGLTVTPTGNGTFDVEVAAGAAAGGYTFQYQPVDNDGGLGPAVTVTVTVPTQTPVLSNPTLGATGGTVDATVAGIDLYWVVTTDATSPNATQIIAGQDANGDMGLDSGNQPVPATGTQTVMPEVYLGGDCYIHYVQSAPLSNIVSSAVYNKPAPNLLAAPFQDCWTDGPAYRNGSWSFVGDAYVCDGTGGGFNVGHRSNPATNECVFPIQPNKTLTMAVDVTAMSPAPENVSMFVRFLDASLAVIGSDVTVMGGSSGSPIGTGPLSGSITTPAGTAYMDFYFRIVNAGVSASFENLTFTQ